MAFWIIIVVIRFGNNNTPALTLNGVPDEELNLISAIHFFLLEATYEKEMRHQTLNPDCILCRQTEMTVLILRAGNNGYKHR